MQRPTDIWQRFKSKSLELIYNTHIEVGVGIGVVAIVGLTVGYNQNATRAQVRPVALSEFGKTAQAYAQEDLVVPPLTRANARCSDPIMKINEAYNFAMEANGSHQAFASEIERKISRDLKVHRLIGEDAALIGQDVKEALQSLDKYRQANAALPAVIGTFGQTWKHDREDFEKDEDCSYQQCDAKGENCKKVEKTCRVYSHSIQHYTYNPQAAHSAQSLLAQYLQKTPDLKIDERMVPSSKTDPENEYAIEKSFREFLENKIPTTAQALGLANVWLTGSNFAVYEGQINNLQAGLPSLMSDWGKAMQTARSQSYRTERKSDDGPREYQLADSAGEHISSLFGMTNKVTSGLQQCAANIPRLNTVAHAYVATVMDGKPGNPDEQRKELLEGSETTYKANFAGGHEINRFRSGEVAILGLIGGLAGGVLGFAVDRGIDYNRRRKQQQRSFH